MDVPLILSTARKQAHTSTDLIDDVELLLLLNILYKKLLQIIKRDVGEEFLYQEFETDLEAGVNSYPLDKATATEDGIDKIRGISIKYTIDQSEYATVRPESFANLDKDLEHYTTFQPISDPFYLVLNDVLRIFPAPTVDVVDGLVLKSLMDVRDLLVTDTEEQIRIKREHHDILVTGLMVYCFQKRGLTGDESFYREEMKSQIRWMVKCLSDIVEWPTKIEIPNLSHLD